LVPRSWTSSPDLHLELDVAVTRGRRAALERALRDAVHDGRLAPGTVLPSSRSLAGDLHLSRGTVVDAYAQLVAEGYLVARPGSVTAVADTNTSLRTGPDTETRIPPARVDLRPGLLDVGSTFPRAEWLRAERVALRTAPDSAFDYGDPRGTIELRIALASYLGRARGVVTTPERIVICAGFAHGLALLSRAFRSAGHDSVAMEDPCLPVHRAIAGDQGLTVAPLPVDDEGARADALDSLGAHVAVVTPAHQYPTGVTLQPGRRTQLVKWARRNDGIVVEDDYDGEFRYDRQPVGALQGLDPEHVVYVGTTSKTIAPGIRIGWLVLPPTLVEPVTEANRHGGASPPALQQLALAELLGSGQLDRHLRRLRVGYRSRRDVLIKALADAVPSLQPTGIAAGLHLLLSLANTSTTEADIRAVAERHGVALAYLGSHWHKPEGRQQGIIVGYSRPTATAFAEVVEDLISILRHVTTQ
jgi:GntR family transcriptional regulator / MocR family aminotransferase